MSDFSDFDFKDFSSQHKRISKRGMFWIVLAAIILLVLIFAGSFYSYVMEYWQIEEIGQNFTSVFWTDITAKATTQGVGFVILFLLFFINVLLLRKLAVIKYFQGDFFKKKWPYILLCFLLALAASNVLREDLYLKFLMAANGGTFGQTDPLFSKDIGYYIFSRPFYITVVGSLKGILMFQVVAIAAIYYGIFRKNDYSTLKEIVMTQRGAVVHVAANLLFYLLLTVFAYRFTAEQVMYSSFGREGDIFGAGYIEANIWLNYYKIAPYGVIAVIGLVLVFLYRKKLIAAGISILAIPVLSFLVGLAGSAVNNLVVNPNERNLQSKYIGYNMEATRTAYGLANITEKEFIIKDNVTKQDIQNNSGVIDNIRITDFGATLTAYNQLQYLRRYYTFNDVDIAPYWLDGKLTAVSIAAREMNKDNIEESAQSYANRVFRYTHGFGVAASYLNKVTLEGQPEFLIKDIPPQSQHGMPKITQPRIYYGELTNDYVIVGPNNKELDYSDASQDVDYSYTGTGGTHLTFLKKLAYAIYYGDYRMYFSGNIDGESRILINRNIIQRVERVAPFFRYDKDPYLVIDDNGNLKWVIDGYTTSSYYPYAQPYQDFNYVRNSVRVIVDAYTGDVKFHLIDQNDPIALAYQSIYPDLFTEEPMDEAIASHIRVPEFMFGVQTQMYQRYHILNADKFYDKDDVWRIATEKYENDEIAVEPYFNVMKIDEDGNEELVLVLPYVLGNKYNMVGMLVQRTNQEHYGELVLYRFPKNETVYGPMQIENKIDNDPDISREMTLWGSGGSAVIRGNLLVVPFKNSLLYVEPIYITSQNNASLPELKRIVVAYKDSIAMDISLNKALEKVFAEAGENVGVIDTEEPTGNAEDARTAVERVYEAYERFKEAARQNDWNAMGEQLEELDLRMNELNQNR